jgi:hypothetical protein
VAVLNLRLTVPGLLCAVMVEDFSSSSSTQHSSCGTSRADDWQPRDAYTVAAASRLCPC